MSVELAQLFLGARLVAPEKAPATEHAAATHRAITVSETAWQHLQTIALLKVDTDWLLDLFLSL